MKRLWILPAVAICTIVAGAHTASAAYCGAISYEGCGGCGDVGGGVAVDGGAVAGGEAVAVAPVAVTRGVTVAYPTTAIRVSSYYAPPVVTTYRIPVTTYMIAY